MDNYLLLFANIMLLYFAIADLRHKEISIYPLMSFVFIVFLFKLSNFNGVNMLLFIIIILLFVIAYYREDNLIYGFGMGDYLVISIILFVFGMNYLFLIFLIFLFIFILLLLLFEYAYNKKHIAFMPFIFLSFNLTLMVYFIIV